VLELGFGGALPRVVHFPAVYVIVFLTFTTDLIQSKLLTAL
jgi:hypothetical protein